MQKLRVNLSIGIFCIFLLAIVALGCGGGSKIDFEGASLKIVENMGAYCSSARLEADGEIFFSSYDAENSILTDSTTQIDPEQAKAILIQAFERIGSVHQPVSGPIDEVGMMRVTLVVPRNMAKAQFVAKMEEIPREMKDVINQVRKHADTKHESKEAPKIPAGTDAVQEVSPLSDSVFLAYFVSAWGAKSIPETVLLQGDKAEVDTRIGKDISVNKRKGVAPWEILGEGLFHPKYDGFFGANFYRDSQSVRLIAIEGLHFSCHTVILSSISQHAAGEVEADFGTWETESGISLSSSRDVIIQELGEPSLTEQFEGYELLIYLSAPEYFDPMARGHAPYHHGFTSGYALHDGGVVEIYLLLWSTERSG